MDRHVFIRTFKGDTRNGIKHRQFADMPAMRERVPRIVDWKPGFGTDGKNLRNQRVIAVDFRAKTDNVTCAVSPCHAGYVMGNFMSFVTAHIEYQLFILYLLWTLKN